MSCGWRRGGARSRLDHTDELCDADRRRLDEAVASLAEGDLVLSATAAYRSWSSGAGATKSSPGPFRRQVIGRPGVTVPSNKLQLATPTPEDLDRVAALAEGRRGHRRLVRPRAGDIEAVREAIGSRHDAGRQDRDGEAIDNLNAIVRSADAVMVARGDLGVRMPIEEVPFHPKEIIRSVCASPGRSSRRPRCSSR